MPDSISLHTVCLPNLVATMHGQPVWWETKNASFQASTHDHLAKFLHVKSSPGHPENVEL